MPATRPVPTQRTAPQVLKKDESQPPDAHLAPAIGGAMIARPGMNLAMTSELMPRSVQSGFAFD